MLLANEQQNLKTLARVLGIDLPQPTANSTPAPMESETASSSPRAVSRWPWPGFSITPGLIEPSATRADMCSDQAAATQEIPAFAETEQRGWECSLLRDKLGANSSASLFLQARGPIHAQADSIRVKFNLAGGTLDGDLAAQALTFFRVAASMPRDPSLSEKLAKMLTTQADFYFFAGYQSLIFRQEVGDPGRYNLIGTDRTSKLLTDSPTIWPTQTQNSTSSQDARIERGPRLLTLPAGND